MRLSERIRGPNWRQEKLATRNVSSLASWIAGTYIKRAEASQEIKVKLNESRLLKFYLVKQFYREFCWKELYKRLEIKWTLKHFDKTKKKKYSNSKNFVFRTHSQISSHKLYKNLQHFIFLSLSFLFLLYKIPF